MNKTELILLSTGIIIIMGCLAGFVVYYNPLFLYGVTLGMIIFIHGFYHEDNKLSVSGNYIKAMISVFILQWIIIIFSINPFTLNDWSKVATFSIIIIIYFLIHLSQNKIAIFKIFFKKEEILTDQDKNTLYNKGNSLKNLKRYNEALKCYEKALKMDSNYKPALEAKEEVLKLMGRT